MKQRIWRRANPQTDRQRLRSNCRSFTNMVIKRGNIRKDPCWVCGDKDVIPHHHDYLNPWFISWLCQDCHRTEHAKRGNDLDEYPLIDVPRANKTPKLVVRLGLHGNTPSPVQGLVDAGIAVIERMDRGYFRSTRVDPEAGDGD